MTPMLDAAFTFASHDDWPRVVSAARDALASDPDEPSAHALLALGLAHLGQSREAVEAGRRAVARDPEMAFAHYAHAWALLEDDDSTRAERAAREALRLQPGANEYGLLANLPTVSTCRTISCSTKSTSGSIPGRSSIFAREIARTTRCGHGGS